MATEIPEIWKDIPEYEGIYEASSLGRIRTKDNKTTFTQRHGVRHWKQRILKYKSQSYQTGYRVTLWKNGKGKDWLVARLVATTFLGESNLTVNHIDGNRFNNCVNNLEWCTIKENIQKAFEIGLYPTQIKTELINKTTGEIKTFNSMSKASQYMNRGVGYVADKIRKNQFENAEFAWNIIK